nr:CinA family protein [Salinibacterium sp.]
MPMDHDDEIKGLVRRVGEAVGSRTVACAESLTAGQIATALGAGESSSEWFRGGVVAYQRETKYRVLGVTPGPVVSESAAAEMARGVAEATGADLAVAVTGVGGPDEQDGQPVGTVFIGIFGPGGERVEHHRFEGEPVEIVRATVVKALLLLAETIDAGSRPT